MKKPQIKKEGNVWVFKVWDDKSNILMTIHTSYFENVLIHARSYFKRQSMLHEFKKDK